MKNISICCIVAVLAIGCADDQSLNSDGNSVEKVPMAELAPERQETSRLLSDKQKCIIQRKCSWDSNSDSVSLSYKDDGQFIGKIESNDLIIKVSGAYQTGKSPFAGDERNWHGDHNWVTDLSVVIDDSDILLPLSVYADMAAPKSIRLIQSSENVAILIENEGDAVWLSFEPIYCNDQNIGEYTITEKLKWYIPMSGDSLEHSLYKIPNCN